MRSCHQLLLCVILLLVDSVRSQERCGSNICPADEECCNQSCGICSPKGSGACTLQYCGPDFDSAFGGCFSAESTVEVLGQGPTPMKELQVGDRIKTASGSYQQVWTFGHYNKETPTAYLKIDTSEGQSLEATGDHLVFLEGSRSPVPAKDVQAGDVLKTNGGGARVEKIQEVDRSGLYAPLTTGDGTLLVNGIAASAYVSLEEFEAHPWLQSEMAFWSHLAVAPFRLFCRTTSSKACQTYNEEGVPQYLASLLRFFQRSSRLESTWFSGVAIGSYLLVAAVASFVEFAFLSLYGILVLVALCFVAYYSLCVVSTLCGLTYDSLSWTP